MEFVYPSLVGSDIDTFSESSNSEDQDNREFVYGGQACSILSSLEETLGKIDDYLSFERGFIHGDIVCSVKNPTGQMGKVINLNIVVDLENINGIKIKDVNSKDLKTIRSISVGDYVVNGAWLGKVEEIIDRVTVLFHDGTKSEFTMSGLEKLVPTSPDLLEDSQYPFYPGQTVEVKCTSVSNSAGWFGGMTKYNRNKGTVCSVDAGLVYVCWLGCALVGSEKISAPSSLQDSKNLSLLSCFQHENWQLGDWCLLQGIDCMDVKRRNFVNAPNCELKGKDKAEKAPQKHKFTQNLTDVAVIVKKKTKVDVLWQDGNYSMGLDSQSLISISLVDPHDFWPGQIVIEKEMCDGKSPSTQKWGIVKSVDAMERTVKVKWCSVALDQPTNVKLQQTEEIVSAYGLIEHPDYSYCFGDAVVRLHKGVIINHSEEKVCGDPLTCKQDTNTGTDLSYADNHRELMSSFIGVVVGLNDGDVEVKWASGVTEKVAPNEICHVEKSENFSSIMPITATDGQMNEEIPEQDYKFLEQTGKDKISMEAPNEDVREKLRGSSSCSFPQAATGLFTHVGSFLFDSLSTYLFGAYEHLSEDEEVQNEEVLESQKMSIDTTATVHIQTTKDTNAGSIVNEVEEEIEHDPQRGTIINEHFRKFDMVNDCSDHHFADGTGNGLESSQIKRIWLKKVQQEWSILKRGLPETIYVRVYEERMDLLRAAIVGPQGTPYHDGLYFFDIFLPSEYPNVPPMVYYNSGGLRINPNLYESGKVCLSLLNTWTGSGSEVWNPNSSTILQILLSLQALVLNEKPYFNEAGYDLQIGTAEAEKNSISYNENAFLVCCKSMLYLLRRPPKHFEALVKEHFNRQGKHFLLACKAYMEGSPVGSTIGDLKMNQESIIGSSMGFKIMIRKLFPRLVEAFSAISTDCSELADLGE